MELNMPFMKVSKQFFNDNNSFNKWMIFQPLCFFYKAKIVVHEMVLIILRLINILLNGSTWRKEKINTNWFSKRNHY